MLCIHLLDHPEGDFDALYALIPAPDYPGGAEIISSRDELRKLYQTGNGSVRLRAIFEHENSDIVITAFAASSLRVTDHGVKSPHK